VPGGQRRSAPADRIVAKVQRLPAAIERDDGSYDRTGLGRQRLQFRQNGVRFRRVIFAIRHGIEPLPRQPGHAAILVPGGVGKISQSIRRANVQGGRHARLRVLGCERKLDEDGFLADRGDRDAATLFIGSAACHFNTHRVGALRGTQQFRCPLAVRALAEQGTQCRSQRRAHVCIRLVLQCRGECAEIAATIRRSDADLGSGSVARSMASSSESGGNLATAMTRRAGSACCKAGRKKALVEHGRGVCGGVLRGSRPDCTGGAAIGWPLCDQGWTDRIDGVRAASVRHTHDDGQFLPRSPVLESFAEAIETNGHAQVPGDWWVVVADVMGSTKAIEAGAYKTVNTVGVACIAAVVNVDRSVDVPFVFGGDGATFAVPDALRERVIPALREAQRLARESFDLSLRVGLVKVSDLLDQGLGVRLAKVRLSPNVDATDLFGQRLGRSRAQGQGSARPGRAARPGRRRPARGQLRGLRVPVAGCAEFQGSQACAFGGRGVE
jgi:hypothetical protein